MHWAPEQSIRYRAWCSAQGFADALMAGRRAGLFYLACYLRAGPHQRNPTAQWSRLEAGRSDDLDPAGLLTRPGRLPMSSAALVRQY